MGYHRDYHVGHAAFFTDSLTVHRFWGNISAILSAICWAIFVLYTAVLKPLSAIEAIITQSIEPIFNPVWVFLVVAEIPGRWALLGGLIVLSSVTTHAVLRRRTG